MPRCGSCGAKSRMPASWSRMCRPACTGRRPSPRATPRSGLGRCASWSGKMRPRGCSGPTRSSGVLGETAARAGVRIGCENCNAEHRFLMSPREFSQFLNDVKHPAVGIHLDVGNIHDTGFAEQWIEIHGPRITRIHLKDVMKHRGRCGDQSVYTNLFLGDNNWPAIRAALTKVDYDGSLGAEMEARYRQPSKPTLVRETGKPTLD